MALMSKNTFETRFRLYFIAVFFFLVIPSYADELDYEVSALAAQILIQYHFTLETGGLRSDTGLARPLMIAIDGPSASGKTTFIKKLMVALSAAAVRHTESCQQCVYGIACNQLGVDQFLYPRAVRVEMFQEHGAGATGNNDGREYRADERNRCLRSIAEGRPAHTCPYDRSTGKLGDSVQLPVADIVIVEGTHCTAPEIRDLYHMIIWHDSDDRLISWNRRFRDGHRGQGVVMEILRVFFQQLDLWRNSHAEAAHTQFSWQPVGNIVDLSRETYESTAPLLRRFTPERINAGIALIRLFQQNRVNSEWINSRFQSLIRPLIPNRHRYDMEYQQFRTLIMTILAQTGYHLVEISHGNDCLFESLASVLNRRGLDRNKIIELLKALRKAYQEKSLNPQQMQLLSWVADQIDSEIEHLEQGHWGGLPTILMFWASELGNSSAGLSPLILVLRIGGKIEIWRLGTDGTIQLLNAIPVGAQVMVFDGVNRWMYGEADNVSAKALCESLTNLPIPGLPRPPGRNDDSGIGTSPLNSPEIHRDETIRSMLH